MPSIFDNIVLTKYYGFTDEEMDFIINYDIKYGMGRYEMIVNNKCRGGSRTASAMTVYE